MKTIIGVIAIVIWLASVAEVQAVEPNKNAAVTISDCLLLIANKQSSVWQEKKFRKGLTLKTIKEIYFLDDLYEEEPESYEFTDYVEEKEEKPVNYVIFSGTGSKAVGTSIFASSIGKNAASIKGKKVVGEDKFLLKAVQAQSEAVSFGPANIVFSGENGTLAEGIEVIPFDIDGDGKVSEAERLAISSLDAFTAYVKQSTNILLVKK